MGKYECPICGLLCKSEHGLNRHYHIQHNKRYLNRTCNHCEKKFRSTFPKKYCSDDCLEAAAPYAGNSNPNYRGAKRTTECKQCGGEFEYYPSEKEGLFCADCVRGGNWQTLPDTTGRNNPRWKGGKRTTECHICGEEIARYPSNMTGEVCLCSEACRRKWLSEKFTGPGHPNWKGGGNDSYGKGWAEARRRALDRDGYRCLVCGTSREEIGRNPDVHHIVPVRRFIESENHTREEAHRLENLVTLCIGCHRKADFGHIPASDLRALVEATE